MTESHKLNPVDADAAQLEQCATEREALVSTPRVLVRRELITNLPTIKSRLNGLSTGPSGGEIRMSDAYVIELQGSAVGIIVRRDENEPAYRFMAALHGFNSLEGVEFSGPFQAEQAARKLWRERPHILSAALRSFGGFD